LAVGRWPFADLSAKGEAKADDRQLPAANYQPQSANGQRPTVIG